MKKILIIISALILIGLAALIFLRGGDTSITEVIRNGLPFGSGEDINIPPTDDPRPTTDNNTFDQDVSALKLFRISNTPVAGFVALARGTDTAVRYVDRATGNIYEAIIYTASTTSTIEKIRLTNNTLPKIYEAYFRSDGSAVLLRSLEKDSDVVENLSLALTPPRAALGSTSPLATSEFYSVSATQLRGNIDSVAVGTGNTLFYILRDTGAIVSSTFTGVNLKTLFNSAFSNWRLSRLGTSIMLYTKASASAPGYAYSLNGSALSKIAGPFNGLTAIGNSDGKKVLYSYYENNAIKLFVKDTAQNISSEILPATLAEKCVWSTKSSAVFFCGTPVGGVSGAQPDGWYQGKTHFSDYIWRFDSNSELARLIVEPKASFDLDLDVYEPKLSPNEDLLIFINKRDLTLWGVRL